jgi:hypothetical protein
MFDWLHKLDAWLGRADLAQQERTITLMIASSGGRITDALEREIDSQTLGASGALRKGLADRARRTTRASATNH